MKTNILALTLIAATTIGITVFPSVKKANAITGTIVPEEQKHSIEVVFILDTTSSMSGLIQAAKEKIWSIASTMTSAQQNPDIKMGLVAFRDRGDAYVTKVLDLSEDLDSMYLELMNFKAQGGGDGPESVNQALDDAINQISWSQENKVYKVAFLIGDAPPHMDYRDDIKFPVTLGKARHKGIIINTIQSGQLGDTRPIWQHIAQLGSGEYFQVEDSGNAVVMSTPFDKKLSELAASLEDTRLFYGDDQQREIQAKRAESAKKLRGVMSKAALARRSTFNATASGEANLLGNSELVNAISSGRVDLNDIAEEELPVSLQAKTPAEKKALIEKQADRRDNIKQEIQRLSESRQRYIKNRIAPEDAKTSLDEKIYGAIKDQAKAQGLVYEADRAEY